MFQQDQIVIEIKGHQVVLDRDDWEKYKSWTWHVIPQSVNRSKFRVRGYLKDGSATTIHHRQYMHRLILGIKDSKVEIDHIDGNPLNNSKSNLRVLGRHQNQQNRGKNRNNTSGFKGVQYQPSTGKWVANIHADCVSVRIGTYLTPEDAAHASDAANKEWYGPDAWTNFP